MVFGRHFADLVTVFTRLFTYGEKNVIELADLTLLVFYEANALTILTLSLLKRLRSICKFWEQGSSFIVVVGLVIVFDKYVHSLHVLINEFAIKAKLLLANIVSTSPKRLTQLQIFFVLFISFAFFDFVEGVATSFDGPLYKFNELDGLFGGIIARHLFGKRSSNGFFHIPFSFIDQIDVI